MLFSAPAPQQTLCSQSHPHCPERPGLPLLLQRFCCWGFRPNSLEHPSPASSLTAAENRFLSETVRDILLSIMRHCILEVRKEAKCSRHLLAADLAIEAESSLAGQLVQEPCRVLLTYGLAFSPKSSFTTTICHWKSVCTQGCSSLHKAQLCAQRAPRLFHALARTTFLQNMEVPSYLLIACMHESQDCRVWVFPGACNMLVGHSITGATLRSSIRSSCRTCQTCCCPYWPSCEHQGC